MSFLGRRRPPEQRQPARVLTAAGRKIDLSVAKPTGGPQKAPWQEDAWAYRDSIGEIRYSVGYLRHAASRVRLVIAVAAPDNQPPTPLAEAEGVPPGVQQAADDALARLTSDTFNYQELLAPYAENLEIAGEAMLVGYQDDSSSEVWGIYSVDEVVKGDRGYTLIDSPGKKDGIHLNPATSYMARLWHPHARYRALADSPMRALLGPCEELQLVARMIRATTRSRFAGAGILALPDEIDFKVNRKPGDDDPEDEDDDPFLTMLTDAMMTAIKDEGDASAVVPILIRANAEAIKGIQHITFGTTVDEKLLNRQEHALRRIAMGLDVPPEIVTGMSDVNHWTAWQVDDSTIRNHVGPLVIRMVDALTSGYLRPIMREYGVPDEWANRVVVWFDTSPLTARPDRSGDAKIGWDSNVLSNRTFVEALGFDPDNDMPDEAELVQRLALQRGAMDGSITEALLRMFVPNLDNLRHLPPGQVTVHNGQDVQDAERDNPPASVAVPLALPAAADPASTDTAPADDSGDDTTTPGPTTGLPASAAPRGPVLRAHRRESARLTRIDSDLRERLTTAADSSVTRAVERAGARVRSAANRDPELRAQVASLAPAGVPAALGQAVVAGIGLDVEQLLAGAWDDLAGRWGQWTTSARTQALATAARLAGQDPTDPTVAAALEAAGLALTEHAVTAWEWLTARLTELTTAVLYDPEHPAGVATDTEQGEDPSRSGRLTSLIRGALSLAGGHPAHAGGVTNEGLPADPGTRLGGIGSGDVVTTYLRDSGQEIIGYEWVYGISDRHFEPHRALDGVIFADFASPALANPGTWPHPTLAPGDHRGCHCDAAPVWADGTSSAATQQAAADATYDDSYLQVLAAIAADDTAAGRTGTSPQQTVAEAQRVAQSRPSQRSTP